MRTRFLVLAFALASLVLPSATLATERPATAVEIRQVAVGKTVNRSMKYGTDGRYSFRGGSPGKYSISNGRICVVFDSGKSRCDSILRDGSHYFLIDAKGKRLPFIPD